MMFRIMMTGLFLSGTIGIAPVQAQTIGENLSNTCGDLGISDGCEIISEAAKMLGPSYLESKARDGEQAFQKLGYNSQYIAAKRGIFQPTIDVFFASKPMSNRLYIVITGTESKRDWIENAKFSSYTAKFKDGQFYVPPAHAGFRRGMLSIVNSGIFHLNEFDAGTPMLRQICADLETGANRNKNSKMVNYLCDHDVADGSGKPIETIIVGHSRGSGIGQVIASIVDGYELSGNQDLMEVKKQENWPLSLHALIGFAPPYAIHDKIDDTTNSKNFPSAGMPSQWQFMKDSGIESKTVLFLNDRDIVPLLNVGFGEGQECGAGRQFGHRYRILRNNEIVYEGTDWGGLASIVTAHSSVGYATAISGKPFPSELECKPSR